MRNEELRQKLNNYFTERGVTAKLFYNPDFDNSIIGISSDNRVVYSHRIDRIEILDDKYMWDEKFKSVKFSFGDSNYYYLCTTKRVYKIHLSKPTYPFASLSYYKQRMALTTM